jgi:Putative auto-transporter adhesin, head GIN domain
MQHTSIISFLSFLLALLFGLSLSGCGYNGNGIVKVERRELGSFKTLMIEQESNISGFAFGRDKMSRFHIKLVKDTVEFASIEYDENLMHHIKTESVNGKLIIRTKKALFSRRDININVHYKELDHLDASTFAEIIFANPYHGNSLQIDLSGACDLRGDIFADFLDLDVAGAADIDLKGKVRKLKGDFAGASSFNAYDLIADSCFMDIAGAADARVNVSQYLKINIAGAADVIYKGSPLIEQDIAGAGEVSKFEKDTL